MNLESKVTELELKDAQMQEKITEQHLLLTSLLRVKNDCTAAAADSNFVLINQSPVAINGLPSSCEDLKMIYVYCDFSKLPSDAGKCFILVIHSTILIRYINNFCQKRFSEMDRIR